MQKKTILVTGASSGMGKDVAKLLLEKGHIVYTAARRVEKMDDLVKAGAIAIKMDITKEEDLQNVVDLIQEHHGGVEILINNAGFGLFGAMEDTTIEDARYQFEVNFFGLARLTQLVLPNMRQKKQGKIINVSSVGGQIYTPMGSWYHASKHALEGWSDVLRLELKQFGIDVVIIQPGAISTEFVDVGLAPALKRSGNSAYAKMANAIANQDTGSANQSSPPRVISNLILKAIEAKNPKIRYSGGKYAKPLLFIRKWFGDRVFDKLVLRMMS